MRQRFRITGFSRKHGSPFIRPFIPFVGRKFSVIMPSICQESPLVGNSGFTLIELIIVLTIASVLAALAVPGMQNFVASNRLAAQVNDLLADISLARSEAIKRNTTTGICVTASGGTSCVASGNWANGWLAYYVCAATDTTCTAGTNVTVKTHEALSGNNTLAGPADAVVYDRSGILSSGSGSFTLCDPKMKKTRVVTLIATGRPTLVEGSC